MRPQRDLKFLEMCKLGSGILQISVVNHSVIGEPVKSFVSNIERVVSMLALPGFSAMAGEYWQMATDTTVKKYFGIKKPSQKILSEKEREVRLATTSTMNKMMRNSTRLI